MKDEDLIKDIIKRYGEVINLKETPHLILEIIRSHGRGVVDVPDGGVSVAGVGTPPGPSQHGHSLGNVVDNTALMKEILKLSKQINALTKEVKAIKK